MRKLRNFIWFTPLLIILCGTYFLLMHLSNQQFYAGDEYPVQFRIKSSREIFKRSEYVTIEATVANVSDYTIGEVILGNCGDRTEVIIDRTIKYFHDDNRCGIGGGLQPGGPSEPWLIELDLSHFESGKHIISLFYPNYGSGDSNGIKSNEIEITLAAAEHVSNCYEFSDYATPLCDQVMITADEKITEDGIKNNEACQYIKDKFLEKNYPKPLPIPALSTEDCNEGNPAIFVFNVYPGSTDHFLAKVHASKESDRVCRTIEYSVQRIKAFQEDGWCQEIYLL